MTAREGQPLETEWTRRGSRSVTRGVRRSRWAARANRALDGEFLREQLGRLGNTPYELAELELEIEGSPFAPSSLLNRCGGEAVEKLQSGAERAAGLREVRPAATRRSANARAETAQSPGAPLLHLLVRTPEQLDAAHRACRPPASRWTIWISTG